MVAKVSARDSFVQAALPEGAFFSEQSSTLAPRWQKMKAGEDNNVYHKRVKDMAIQAKGQMVFRPSPDAALGIISKQIVIECDTIAPRWSIQRAPESWIHADDVEVWAKARGFVNISAISRSGRKKWFFRGDLADCSGRAAFQFFSGALVSMVVPGPRARGEEGPKPKSAWGAPGPKFRDLEGESRRMEVDPTPAEAASRGVGSPEEEQKRVALARCPRALAQVSSRRGQVHLLQVPRRSVRGCQRLPLLSTSSSRWLSVEARTTASTSRSARGSMLWASSRGPSPSRTKRQEGVCRQLCASSQAVSSRAILASMAS